MPPLLKHLLRDELKCVASDTVQPGQLRPLQVPVPVGAAGYRVPAPGRRRVAAVKQS